ncbi:MAG: flagellar motor switch protein FliN [Rhodospirillaceae bacterium]|jgi:flagellar motor switch protein FliN/FliY
MVDETGEEKLSQAEGGAAAIEDKGRASDSTHSAAKVTSAEKLNMLQSIEVQLSVEVGRAKMTIKDLLLLNEGSVIELDRMAGDPLEIIVNGASIAKGEIVMVGDKFGIRFVDISEPEKIAQSI